MSVYVNRFDAHNNAMMIVYHVFWLKIHVSKGQYTEIIQFLVGEKTIFLKCYFNVTRLCNAFLSAAIQNITIPIYSCWGVKFIVEFCVLHHFILDNGVFRL